MSVVRLEDVEAIRFSVVGGSSIGSQVTFAPEPRAVKIGRAVDNDIVINDPAVSRAHARVDIGAEGARIQDLGSAGGVEKMGFRLGTAPEPLLSGDEFKIGTTILRYELVLKKRAARRPVEETKKKKLKLPPPGEIVDRLRALLERVGLNTPARQIVALAAVAALLVYVFWPAEPGLAPQASAVPTPISYDGVIGFVPGGDQSHLDGAIFDMPAQGDDGQALYLKVNAPYGLDVRVGKQVISSLKPTPEWQEFVLIVIPRAVAPDGSPRVVLDNLGYSPEQGAIDPATAKGWAVSRMWIARLTAGTTLAAQLIGETTVLEVLSEQVVQEPKALYRLMTGLRSLVLGMMKVAGRPAVLVPIPVAAKGNIVTAPIQAARAALEAGEMGPALDRLVQALGGAEGTLSREFRERINALQLMQKRGASKEAGTLVFFLEGWIPETSDPRYREIKNYHEKLDVAGQIQYDETRKKTVLEAEPQ
jgi:pSer/pThr/pTyr-binding forkhead associated (FHA) protein